MRKLNIILISFPFLLVGCNGYKYQPDNLVEEIAEEGVKAGAKAFLNVDLPDFDFSPGTPEKGFSPHSISPLVKEVPEVAK